MAKDKIFNFRLTAEELEQIEINAKDEGFPSPAEYARARLLYKNGVHSSESKERVTIALHIITGLITVEDLLSDSGKLIGIPVERQRTMSDEALKDKAVEVLTNFLFPTK